MLQLYSGLNDLVVLAIERHRALIEEAQRDRQRSQARRPFQERPARWRRAQRHFRNRVGDLLVNWGERIKTGSTHTALG